jgi:catechol 2,3-dioxygenase-like lactoylglutathione lyase family enzyme
VGFGLETYEPAERVLARLQGKGVRITSEIIRYEGGNCFMLLDLDGLPTYVNEFPPDMVPPTDLSGTTGGAKTASSDTRLGGHAIVYVSNMDAAVRFYNEKLGLPLIYRFEDKFATVEAGNLSLAIHPKTPNTPDPGKKGSVALGLQVDEPIERVVSRLSERGVRITSEAAVPDAGKRVEFEDEDGNPIYLWEVRATAARAASR